MTSFRPKPIDIHKSLPFIPEEEVQKEAISRCVPELETGVSLEEQHETHLQMILKEKKRKLIPIPTPSFRIVQNGSKQNRKKFKQPTNYIQFQGEWKFPFTYEVDSDDEKLIRRINSKRGKKVLSPETFETFVELLEEKTEKKGKIPELDTKLIEKSTLTPAVAGKVYSFWIERHQLGRYTLKGRKMEEFQLLRSLRLELEKVRTLAEMVRKREKLKKEKVLVMMKMFNLFSSDKNCTNLKEESKVEESPSSLEDKEEDGEEVIRSPQDSKGIPKRPKAHLSSKRKNKRRKLSISHTS